MTSTQDRCRLIKVRMSVPMKRRAESLALDVGSLLSDLSLWATAWRGLPLRCRHRTELRAIKRTQAAGDSVGTQPALGKQRMRRQRQCLHRLTRR